MKLPNYQNVAITLSQEIRDAVDTKYWVNGTWTDTNFRAIQRLYDQLCGIQRLLALVDEDTTEAFSAVAEQIRYLDELLDAKK